MKKQLNRIIALLILGSLLVVACGNGGDDLESAKQTICDEAPDWQATLERVAQAEEDPGTLSTEVDELATGIDGAAQALSDAGADAIANAATSFGGTIDEIAISLEQGGSEAAVQASESLDDLDALTTLADCDTSG